MTKVREGDRVSAHYKGWLSDDGTVFGDTAESGPVEFTAGGDDVLPAFGAAVVGMETGEQKQFTVEPDQGFGERNESLVAEVGREQVPDNVQVGDQLTAETAAGPTPVRVVQITDDNVTIDANHPLAGKKLEFEVQVESILDADDSGD